METYYHINKVNNSSWQVGDEIELEGINNYWQSFVEKVNSFY